MIDDTKQSNNTEEDNRISGISNVSNSIIKMQKELDKQRIAYTNTDEDNVKLQNSMIKMLGSVSNTISQIGSGFQKVATGTLETGKDAITQYRKSISKDISYDKQNIIAMALSKTSPLFGYFASKFMETDVFKSAATRIKTDLSDAMGVVSSKFKKGFGSFFESIKFKSKKDKPIKIIGAKNKIKIPKMASGGYVEKAGLAKLHAAEVVMPIDKILSRIDESISTTKDLVSVSRSAQLKTLANMGTYVKGIDKMQKVGMFKGFMRALKTSNEEYNEPSNVRMLRAVLSIQDSMGATVGTWPQVWQKMLIEHPTFRSIVFTLKSIGKVVSAPFKIIYSIFKSRGGYKAHLSHAKNPTVAVAENVGLIYSEGMWRLDNIAKFTRASAEASRDISSAITGKKYSPLEGISTGRFSLFGGLRKITNFLTKYTLKLIGKSDLGEMLTKQRRLIPIFGRKKEMHELYGRGGISSKAIGSSLSPELLEGLNIANQPIIESIQHMTEQSQICCSNANKDNVKLIGYTKEITNINEDNLKIQKKINKRGRLRMIMDRFKNTKIGGFLSLITTFLVPFLFKGGLKKILMSSFKTIGKSILKPLFTSIALKLFPKGIKVALTTIATKIIPLLSKFAGPFAALASAGILGWKIGKGIDKTIGISKKFNKMLDKWDEKVNKSAAELSKQQSATFKKAIGGYAPTKEKFKARREIDMQRTFGASDARYKSLGYFGRSNVYEINIAQQKYINKNIETYLKYSYDEIIKQRAIWNKRGYSGKAIGVDSTAYGMRREKSFLLHLKKSGTTLTEKESSTMFDTYKDKWNKRNPNKAFINKYTKAGYAIEGTIKGSEVVSQKVKDIVNKYITKGKLKEGMSELEQKAVDLAIYKEIQETVESIKESRKLIEAMNKHGEQAVKSGKELTDNIIHGLVHTTNNITTSVQNTTSNVANNASAAASKFSETTQAVLQGV